MLGQTLTGSRGKSMRRGALLGPGSPGGRGLGRWVQSCPTLCDPIDGSPPGSPVPGSLQAGTLEWEGVANPTGVVIVVLLYGFWIMLGVKQNVFVDLYKC